MTMLVVDLYVWIDYFNGAEMPQVVFLHRNLDRVPILVGDLILAEVLQGFRHTQDFETALLLVSRFTQVQMVNPELAVQSARNFRLIQYKCVTVRKTIDS
jgi:hypothetical protein